MASVYGEYHTNHDSAERPYVMVEPRLQKPGRLKLIYSHSAPRGQTLIRPALPVHLRGVGWGCVQTSQVLYHQNQKMIHLDGSGFVLCDFERWRKPWLDRNVAWRLILIGARLFKVSLWKHSRQGHSYCLENYVVFITQFQEEHSVTKTKDRWTLCVFLQMYLKHY